MQPDRLAARLGCMVGRHKRSRGHAHVGKGASGTALYESICRGCGQAMEKRADGRWTLSHDRGRAPAMPSAWIAASALALALLAAGIVGWRHLGTIPSPNAVQAGDTRLTPDDPRLVFSAYAGQLQRSSDFARIVRPIDTTDQGDSSGLKYAAPGARVSLTLDQHSPGRVTFALQYDGLMNRADLYNGGGVLLVDDKVASRFDLPLADGKVSMGDVDATATVPAGHHVVALVMPYAASVRLAGVGVPTAARVSAGPPRLARRIVLIGDSRFNGAAASNISGTLAFQLAQRLKAEVIDLANGGRQLAPSDFSIAGSLAPDVALSLYDFNDFYPGGASTQEFGLRYAAGAREFLTASAKAAKPHARLVIVTSFASSSDAGFSPPGRYARNQPPLESFRAAERREVAALHDSRVTIVEGRGRGMPAATPDNSPDGVHFNDAAQAAQAAILAAAVR